MDAGFILSTILMFTGIEGPLAKTRMPPPTPEVKRLMVELGDDEWTTRQEAEARLKELDYAALRAVLAGLKDKDLEVRNRCRRIANHYYFVRTPKDAPVEATRIPASGLVVRYKQGGKELRYVIPRDRVMKMYMDLWHQGGREPAYVWYDSDISCRITAELAIRMRDWGVPKEAVEKALTEVAKGESKTDDIVHTPPYPTPDMTPPGPLGRIIRRMIPPAAPKEMPKPE